MQFATKWSLRGWRPLRESVLSSGLSTSLCKIGLIKKKKTYIITFVEKVQWVCMCEIFHETLQGCRNYWICLSLLRILWSLDLPRKNVYCYPTKVIFCELQTFDNLNTKKSLWMGWSLMSSEMQNWKSIHFTLEWNYMWQLVLALCLYLWTDKPASFWGAPDSWWKIMQS